MTEPAKETEAPQKPVVEIVALSKRYGRTQALHNVTMDVGEGEALCVIGPNGAGKTSFLFLLGGILFPSSGHVHVFGMHRWKENFQIRRRSITQPTEPIFGESPTPYEYFRFVAQIYNMPREDFVRKLKQLCVDMDFTDHVTKGWARMSTGLRKKAALIAAFLPEVDLRILDEPFAGGIDPIAVEVLYQWIFEARDRGETIVFSSQVLEHAANVGSRVLFLREGRVEHLGTILSLIESAGVDPHSPRALAEAFQRLMRIHLES
jgi:ABC-2 type transport system ATP-binding protein